MVEVDITRERRGIKVGLWIGLGSGTILLVLATLTSVFVGFTAGGPFFSVGGILFVVTAVFYGNAQSALKKLGAWD